MSARHVVLVSPHLDDAVMSVGASIAALRESGEKVVVCTAFAGDAPLPLTPAAQAFHDHCGLSGDSPLQRRIEDSSALEILDAEPIYLDFPDAIYRTVDGQPLVSRPGAMFQLDLPFEAELVDSLTLHLLDVFVRLRARQVWTCRAIGEHVDHRHTRAAATVAASRAGIQCLLWEDLPYAFGTDATTRPDPDAARCDESHLATKLAAIARYRSQVEMLWPEGDWQESFLRHATARTRMGVMELVSASADG